MGFINEQTNWKQRFFVPSDETSGIDILEALLERYPVLLTEAAVGDGEGSASEITPQAEIRATEIVDLDQWIVAFGKVNPEDQTADEIDQQVDAAEQAATEEEPPFTLTQEATWAPFQIEQTQLVFSFG
ncbi:MAG TPA: hypothetical protein VGO56_17185 [Pyrinomonadaceae bacterium]|nr:hypothetical protein [Pyrinomonadaceae bacterium]